MDAHDANENQLLVKNDSWDEKPVKGIDN